MGVRFCWSTNARVHRGTSLKFAPVSQAESCLNYMDYLLDGRRVAVILLFFGGYFENIYIYIYIYIYICKLFADRRQRRPEGSLFKSYYTTPMGRFLVNLISSGPGDRGSIPGRFKPKTQKWYLIPLCLILCIIR